VEVNLTSVSVVRQQLASQQIRPSKRLGQNFLVDANIVNKIVAAVEPDSGDLVIEIGAGLGTLTKALAEHAGAVIAVEKDHRLSPLLQQNLGHLPHVRVIEGDILELPIDTLVSLAGDYGIIKTVGNLPYYVTSPIIMHLLAATVPLASITCMVQREVAQRILASPGTKEYGVLSVAAQAKSVPELVCNVPRTVFYPKPEVDSAVIRLIPREQPFPNAIYEETFFRVVKAAFGQRRKTIGNALKRGLEMPAEAVDELLAKAQIDPMRRGETLSGEEFYQLTEIILRGS